MSNSTTQPQPRSTFDEVFDPNGKHPYRTIGGTQCAGRYGMLGIRIDVAGTNLPDLGSDAIQDICYNAIDKLRNEIMAATMAKDEEFMANARAEREAMIKCFGNESIFVEETPNKYWGDHPMARHHPWMIVTTHIGRIRIGARKRVFEIDWSETVGTKTSEELFKDENVTKGDKSIHAWSIKDAERYIATIINSAQ